MLCPLGRGWGTARPAAAPGALPAQVSAVGSASPLSGAARADCETASQGLAADPSSPF